MVVYDSILNKIYEGKAKVTDKGWVTVATGKAEGFTFHKSNKTVVVCKLGPYTRPKLGGK